MLERGGDEKRNRIKEIYTGLKRVFDLTPNMQFYTEWGTAVVSKGIDRHVNSYKIRIQEVNSGFTTWEFAEDGEALSTARDVQGRDKKPIPLEALLPVVEGYVKGMAM